MTPLGIVLAAPLLPILAKSCRPWTVAVGAVVAIAASLVLLKLLPGFAAWLVLRFVLGVAIGFLFAVTEAWIAALAPPNGNRTYFESHRPTAVPNAAAVPRWIHRRYTSPRW